MKKQIRQNWHTIRISNETKMQCSRIAKVANQKKLGRKVKIDEVLKLALSLITDAEIKKLQNSSLSNEDRKEQLRQMYIKKIGAISKDEFIGFIMKPEFLNFINTNSDQENF